jgi:CBS domain-containing protein
MQTTCPTIEDSAMLDAAFQLMREAECPLTPVLKNGRLVGLLTLENVGEWMMIASALKEPKGHRD